MNKGGFTAIEDFRFDRIIGWLRRIKTWQLIILLIFSLFISGTFLRLNRVGMNLRYDAVVKADEAGRDGDIADRLYDLQRYASSHMNAGVSEIYLNKQYERDNQRAYDAKMQEMDSEVNINVQVDAICAPRFSTWSPAYVQCFAEELDKFPAAPDPTEVFEPLDAALYRHSFVSPYWSPDFAGFSILASLILGFIILGRFAQYMLLHILLKLRQRGRW